MVNCYGLTTSEAVGRLQFIIQEELESHSKKNKKTLLYLVWETLSTDKETPVTWYSLVASVLLAVALSVNIAYDESGRVPGSLISELVIFIITILLGYSMCVREHYLKNDKMERLVRTVSNEIHDPSQQEWPSSVYPSLGLTESDSISLIWTYRDNKIVNLPWNLLVDGDIIILGPSRVAPAGCRQVFLGPEKHDGYRERTVLEAGEVFNPKMTEDTSEGQLTLHPRCTFEVLQPPIKSMIRAYLGISSIKKPSKLSKKVSNVINIIENRVLWVILILSLVVNVIRKFLLKGNNGDMVEMICYIQAITIMPLLPLSFPFIWYFISYYGSARLVTLFNSSTKKTSLFGIKDCEELQKSEVDIKSALKLMWNILKRDPKCIPRTVNLLHTLGSITTFCCVDKEGILCSKIPVPEKIGFFRKRDSQRVKQQKLQKQDSFYGREFYIATDSENEDLSMEEKEEEEGAATNEFEILSVSHDVTSENLIQFDDVLWKESLGSLQPISEDISGHLSLARNNSAVASKRSCFCGFANYVGFNKDLMGKCSLKQHVTGFMQLDSSEVECPSNYFLSIIREKHVPFLTSTIAGDKRQGIDQLLSQGTADLILNLCTDVWNGEEISELKDIERKKALNFFQRMNITGSCIAFSYRPIFQDLSDGNHIYINFKPDMMGWKENESNEYVNDRKRNEKPQLKKVERNVGDLTSVDMMQNIPSTNPTSDVLVRNLNEQIFLGMITLTQALKEDVVSMVEQLDQAGIRFVHFSYENELLSRVFCQRLGLETGWNCHISLGENIVDEWSSSAVSDSYPLLLDDDQDNLNKSVLRCNTDTSISLSRQEEDDGNQYDETYDELYFMSNRSKLPKGIQHMRSHLEDVDDVPLLVPLFTDCHPKAVGEMIGIMQEYNEIVCCIGSSLNAKNFKIFMQSDLSIGMEPVIEENCILHEDDDVFCGYENDGSKAMKGARRLTIGCENCFLFMFSTHVMLALLMLLSAVFLLPPPLTGLQLMWLIYIIIPLVGISLIGGPADGDLMRMLTGKRRKEKVKELALPFVQFILLTFLLNVLFILLVLYPWALHTTCGESNIAEITRCQWFTGAENITSSWNGWYKELKGGFYMVQDFLLFYTTVTIILLSVSFVNRRKLLWKQQPFRNRCWCISVLISFVLQFFHTCISMIKWQAIRQEINVGLYSLHPAMYIVAILWLVLLVVISEFIKHKNIRAYIRYQKRERLKFDTKLGMNSPV